MVIQTNSNRKELSRIIAKLDFHYLKDIIQRQGQYNTLTNTMYNNNKTAVS